MPQNWTDSKNIIAKDIYNKSIKEDKILSIGCGIGFVESRLEELRGNGDVIAIDPNGNHSFISDKVDFRRGYFPHAVQGEKIDFAYAGIIDYCFSDEEYVKFLENIRSFGIKRFMLANCLSEEKECFFMQDLKEFISELLSMAKLRSRGQFWGYLRGIEDQVHLLERAGFSNLEVGVHGGDNGFWIVAQS